MTDRRWRRLEDNKIYHPGKDSPENHYVSDDLCWELEQFVNSLTPQEMTVFPSIERIFVEDAAHTAKRLPNRLIASVLSLRDQIADEYQRDWKRLPYAEELKALCKLVKRAK